MGRTATKVITPSLHRFACSHLIVSLFDLTQVKNVIILYRRLNSYMYLFLVHASLLAVILFNRSVCGNMTATEAFSIIAPPKDQTVAIYSSVNFSCKVSGNPEPTIQWFQNGKQLDNETLTYLYIPEVGPHHRGMYHCVAHNEGCSSEMVISSKAILNIPGENDYNYFASEAFGATIYLKVAASVTSTLIFILTVLHFDLLSVGVLQYIGMLISDVPINITLISEGVSCSN